MSGGLITIAAVGGGDAFGAYLALPPAASAPGIVLLHTAFGLDRHMRDLACLYAEEGYVVICPDLYWRLEPGLDLAQNEAGRRQMLALDGKFDRAAALTDITRTIAALRDRRDCTGKVGAIGSASAATSLIAPRLVGHRLRRCVLPGRHRGGARSRFRDRLPDGPAFRRERRLRPGIDGGGCERGASPPPRYSDLHLSAGAARFQPSGRRRLRQNGGRAHSRSIALLRRTMGPHYELEALWEAHAR